MGSLGDFVHGLFVLLTVLSFALPIYEAIQRRSVFYLGLFITLGILSFAMHCEETGICSPLSNIAHRRLQTVDLGLSWMLFQIMFQVVLEIRNEVPGRVVAAVTALIISVRDVFDMKRNLLATAIVSIVLLMVDLMQYKRKFTAARWRRLALIGGMAAVGALLFRALKYLWAWHGIWHIYYVCTCYLLLVAQRHNRTLTAANKSRVVGGGLAGAGTPSFASSLSSAASGLGLSLSTPVKASTSSSGSAGFNGVSHGASLSSSSFLTPVRQPQASLGAGASQGQGQGQGFASPASNGSGTDPAIV